MIQLDPSNPDAYYNVACIYSRQGKVDEALKWLSDALGKGFHNQNLLMTDPDLENIRSTEFYKQILLTNNK